LRFDDKQNKWVSSSSRDVRDLAIYDFLVWMYPSKYMRTGSFCDKCYDDEMSNNS